jgi:Fe-S-cluster-containing hydrogenase component 2
MTVNERQLLVSGERCIGCRACATVCPEGLITLGDADHRRTVWFAALCAEDCTLCAEACPTEAISLQPVTGFVLEERTRLDFELWSCAGCGAPAATAEMLAWLRTVIPTQMQTDAEGQEWLELCPRCRQEAEAQRIAREGIMTRWP